MNRIKLGNLVAAIIMLILGIFTTNIFLIAVLALLGFANLFIAFNGVEGAKKCYEKFFKTKK